MSNSKMVETYKGVKYAVGVTSVGVSGPWIGEYGFSDESKGDASELWDYKMVPGEFSSDGEAINAAREHVKTLVDQGHTRGAG